VVKVFVAKLGVQGSSLIKDVIVVNGGMLIEYSPMLHKLFTRLTYLS
jgi:hypothetical protein